MKTKFLCSLALVISSTGFVHAQYGGYSNRPYSHSGQPSLAQNYGGNVTPVQYGTPQVFSGPNGPSQPYGTLQPSVAPLHPSIQSPAIGYQNPQRPVFPNQYQRQAQQYPQQAQQYQRQPQNNFSPQAATQWSAYQATGSRQTPYFVATDSAAGNAAPEMLPNSVAQPNTYVNPSPPAAQQPYGQPAVAQPAPTGHSILAGPTYDSGITTVGPDGSCNGCGDGGYSMGYGAPGYGAPGYEMWGGPPNAFGGPGCAPPPVAYGPVPLKHWFGGASLLFLVTEENHDRRLVYDVGNPVPTLLSTKHVDPDFNVGFDVFAGRYLNCGRHAITAKYFFFDPSNEAVSITQPPAGLGALGNPFDYIGSRLDWANVSFDVGQDGLAGNDDTMFNLYDAAQSFRVRRNVSFQGLEFEFHSFGLGGARRGAIGPLPMCGGCAGPGVCGGMCGSGCGPGACVAPGCAGPMVPGCNSKLQIRTSHGLRWFQFRDSFEFAASTTDAVYGLTDDDYYYNVDTENNLFGYQFGSRLDYCLGHKIFLHVGAKFGIYANDVEYNARLGTATLPSYVNGNLYTTLADEPVVIRESDTVLSALGELDLGASYRIGCCWTVGGGYRMYGATGVATSVGSIADDIANLPEARKVYADDSLLLHGGYFDVSYNW